MKLTILRHAPTIDPGRLAGRTDIAADCSDAAALACLRGRLGRSAQVIASPARRCLQTAEALGLGKPSVRAGLWEQDHGAWEGLPLSALPDLGPLPLSALARHRAEGGESFEEMAARVQAEIATLDGDTLIVAHAGTVRAALALVVGPAAALAFAVSPLSLSRFRRVGADWSVECVNETAPCSP